MAMPHRVDMHEARAAVATREDFAYQAFRILQVAFVLAPVIAGVDKFFGFLVNWDQYLSPTIATMLPVAPHTFMLAVGVIEIVVGLIVATRPYYGGYLVTLWLWAIIVNLLMVRGYYDIALRDFGLSLGATALARLSHRHSPQSKPLILLRLGGGGFPHKPAAMARIVLFSLPSEVSHVRDRGRPRRVRRPHGAIR